MYHRALRHLPMVALAFTFAACSGTGLGDILNGTLGGGGAQNNTVTVEVQQVRQQDIIVRTQDGQQGQVLYDSNTQVVYNNEQYQVNALDQGDIVDMRIQQVQSGYYTDLIQVRTPVQDRQNGTAGGATSSGVYQVEGTVGEVNGQSYRFTLNMTQGGTVTVYLPSNASASERDRLRRLLPGDYVRVEVRPVDDTRAELVNFGWS